MVRVVLVEDFELELERLEFALRTVPGLTLLADSGVEDAIEYLAGLTTPPDVFVVKHTGNDAGDRLLESAGAGGVRKRVLVMGPAAGGAPGAFDAQIPISEFIAAIRELAEAQSADGRNNGHRSVRALSHQEQKAAGLVLEGLANKEIAVRMEISESAVKALLQRVFLKLGVRTRGQLVRLMLEAAQAGPPVPEQTQGASG